MAQPVGAGGAVQLSVTLVCVIAEELRPVGALGLIVQPPFPLHGPTLVQSAGVADLSLANSRTDKIHGIMACPKKRFVKKKDSVHRLVVSLEL